MDAPKRLYRTEKEERLLREAEERYGFRDVVVSDSAETKQRRRKKSQKIVR